MSVHVEGTTECYWAKTSRGCWSRRPSKGRTRFEKGMMPRRGKSAYRRMNEGKKVCVKKPPAEYSKSSDLLHFASYCEQGICRMKSFRRLVHLCLSCLDCPLHPCDNFAPLCEQNCACAQAFCKKVTSSMRGRFCLSNHPKKVAETVLPHPSRVEAPAHTRPCRWKIFCMIGVPAATAHAI